MLAEVAPNGPGETWVSSSDAKTLYGLTPGQLRKAHTDGRIRAEKRGNRLWYPEADLRREWPDCFD